MPNKQEIVDPLSLNLYAYCYNNPILYQDPSGNVSTIVQLGQQVLPPVGEAVNVVGSVVAAVGGAVILSLSTPADFTGRGYPNPKKFKKPEVEKIPLHDENKNVGTNKVDAKKTSPPSKLKDGDRVKTPNTHPDEFTKNKDGSYTHNKTGWNFKDDKSGHGGKHWDAKPPNGKTGDYQNVYPDGTVR